MGIISKVEQKLHMGGSSKNVHSGAAPTHGEHSSATTGSRSNPLGGTTAGKDRDHDGVPDKLEHGRDRNHDGIPDKLQGKGAAGGPGVAGLANRDRDHDGIPDKLEGKGHTGATGAAGLAGRDRNHDGIPDKLEGAGAVGATGAAAGLASRDRDHDGIPDKLEDRGHGGAIRGAGLAGRDRDHDGIPDTLEGRGTHATAGVAGGDRDHDGIPDRLEGRADVVDSTYERVHHAPVVKETVRDEYVHNIQPVVQKEHDKTDIIKTVQPLKDAEITDTRVHTKQRVDQFREVGQDERIARETEEKLRLHREEVARQGGRVHLEDTHSFTENAAQVHHTERRHVIEEVQPVIERDVLRPHVVEETQNVFVHEKEAAVLKEVRVAPVMSVREWERTQAAQGESVTGGHTLAGAHDRNHDGIPDNLQHGKDRNHDGIPDNLQHGRDKNHDGIPDSLQHGTQGVGAHGKDRNHDGIPDSLQHGTQGVGAQGLGAHGKDRNHDGIPDNLQHGKDRNHDGIPDSLQHGTRGVGAHGKDRNHDGIPDSLQHGRDRNHDGIPDNQQRRL